MPQENFLLWTQEWYTFRDESGQPNCVCIRCGMIVGYLTMHAVERHGDDIGVLPCLHPELAEDY